MEKMDYLSDTLGVKTLMVDDVIDPSNFRRVRPEVGTNQDAIDLVLLAHEKRMYVGFQLDPNYSRTCFVFCIMFVYLFFRSICFTSYIDKRSFENFLSRLCTYKFESVLNKKLLTYRHVC